MSGRPQGHMLPGGAQLQRGGPPGGRSLVDARGGGFAEGLGNGSGRGAAILGKDRERIRAVSVVAVVVAVDV